MPVKICTLIPTGAKLKYPDMLPFKGKSKRGLVSAESLLVLT